MINSEARRLTLVLTACTAWSTTASAEPQSFTRFAEFLAAAPATVKTLDFDELAPGTGIAAKHAAGDIKFEYDFGGIRMEVAHRYATTSTPNFLGTSDGGMFHDGDDFAMEFPQGHAIGLFFISADPLFDGDLTLSAGGSTSSLRVGDREGVLPDGSSVYFLGIVDRDSAFTRAEIVAIAGGFFLYNVDDIITAPQVNTNAAALID